MFRFRDYVDLVLLFEMKKRILNMSFFWKSYKEPAQSTVFLTPIYEPVFGSKIRTLSPMGSAPTKSLAQILRKFLWKGHKGMIVV